jgi:alanine dehydrogenase
MRVRVISGENVTRLLTMPACIGIMEEALRTFARGNAVLPLRSLVRLPGGSGILGLMPGYLGAPPAFGLKVVTVMRPGSPAGPPAAADAPAGVTGPGSAHPTHQGLIAIFDPATGAPLAFIDAASVTAIRTAAVSGAATQALARKSAGDLAILGCGVQARTHLESMAAVRRLRRIRVWSRDAGRARRFADEAAALAAVSGGFAGRDADGATRVEIGGSSRSGAGEDRAGGSSGGRATPVAIEAVATARAAVEGADIVCTTTASPVPVLEGSWLAPGAHINAVGACFPSARELDTAAVVRSRLYVDCRESAMNEAGDFLIPKREGAIGDGHIVGDLGDLFLGRLAGRTSEDEITLFKSLGIAIEDLAVAEFLLRQARETGAGVEVPF